MDHLALKTGAGACEHVTGCVTGHPCVVGAPMGAERDLNECTHASSSHDVSAHELPHTAGPYATFTSPMATIAHKGPMHAAGLARVDAVAGL